MRMLYSDCDKNDAFALIKRIKTLEKQSLYTPKQVLEQRLEKIKIEPASYMITVKQIMS